MTFCCKPACGKKAIKRLTVDVLGHAAADHDFCAQHLREYLGKLADLASGDHVKISIERSQEGTEPRRHEATECVKAEVPVSLFPGGRTYR